MRLGRPTDAPAIGVLLRRVMRRWVVPDQPSSAVAVLLAGAGSRAIRQEVLLGRRFHLAYVGTVLVGVAAIRDDSHLFQLHVSTRYQGQGIARLLWQRVMRDSVKRSGTRHFTLNSAPMAVPVYRQLGFVEVGPERISPAGIRSTPMRLILDAPNRRSKPGWQA
ncbi:GNAT family N-acetyltransferase [Dyella silvatica]|uniref:GNAT family N-acetyltransferase n=1 Tax=Dyella silvatica TaxID=2992128 RepID=UPI0022573224|nr:GNAT family N-acetyltransferase [Dyella silvatica]